jgi:hypothetical protein
LGARELVKFWVRKEKISFRFSDTKQIASLWNNLWSSNQVISIDYKLSSSVMQDAKRELFSTDAMRACDEIYIQATADLWNSSVNEKFLIYFPISSVSFEGNCL